MDKGVANLTFPLKGNYVAMLAPSFVVDFSYPQIISRLKKLGFDKVVELTFGAKMINREYHKILNKTRKLIIASPCPGIVETIKLKFPQYRKNLAQIDSPMIATAKICKKIYLKHKIVFISPCHYKKIEARNSKEVDYVIDYKELEELFIKYKIPKSGKKIHFDKFYNDYTKIYPIAGGLSKTAHLKNILKPNQTKIIDGMSKVSKFLEKPLKKIKFLDVTFCKGGCIGGPCIVSKLPMNQRRKKVLDYLKIAEKEKIPEGKKGILNKARGISFSGKCWFN